MNLTQKELLSQLRQIDEYEFEQLVADIWEQQGWKTTVTTGSGDRGIDVIAQKSGPFSTKYLIQAKRYSIGNKIGSPDIQQYSSLKHQEENVDAVVIVTTSSFTSQAKRTANDLNVKLIDGNSLYEMVDTLDKRDFLSKYIQISQSPDVQLTTGSSTNLGNNLEKDDIQPAETKKNDQKSKSKQKEKSVSFSGCPICTPKGQVGFREGHCISCDSDWIKHSGLVRTKWEVDGGPENGEVKTGVEWQEYLYDSNTAENTDQNSNNTSESHSFAGVIVFSVLILSILLSVILGLYSLLTWSIHQFLFPIVGVTISIVLIMMIIGWWLSKNSQESEEKSEKEETPPRGIQ